MAMKTSLLNGRLRVVLGFVVSLVVTIFGLLLVTFVIGRVVPIDPILSIVGERATQAQIEAALGRPLAPEARPGAASTPSAPDWNRPSAGTDVGA